jgi:lipid A 3-O-deacylase
MALIGFALLRGHAALAADVIPPIAPILPPSSGESPQSGRITIIEDNDALAPDPTDRWFTQGLELRYLSPPLAPASGLLAAPSFFDPTPIRQQRYELLFGQDIFTPANLTRSPPDPKDRPYAGWLYAGAGLYRESTDQSLDHFELDVGVVGPAALAKQVQDSFHNFLSSIGLQQYQPAAWDYQLKNEPGFVVSYEHKWRFGVPIGGGLSVDAIPEVGFSAGNVYTYAETGAFLRLGHGLNVDYGPAGIRPALSGGSWFDPSQLNGGFGWYVFAGGQARAVARDIFLDGNTLATSPWIEKRPVVGTLSAGLSLFWSDVAKVDFVLSWESKEFVGQSAPERYGGINISFRTP